MTAIDRFEPGQRVAVIQQIPQRDTDWTIRVEGTVVRFEQRKTGSWYARSKDDRLWLDRLVLKKDDGELVVCNLDQYTRVEAVPGPASAPAPDTAHVQPASAFPPRPGSENPSKPAE